MIEHTEVSRLLAVEFGGDGVNVALKLATKPIHRRQRAHIDILLTYAEVHCTTISYENITPKLKVFIAPMRFINPRLEKPP